MKSVTDAFKWSNSYCIKLLRWQLVVVYMTLWGVCTNNIYEHHI